MLNQISKEEKEHSFLSCVITGKHSYPVCELRLGDIGGKIDFEKCIFKTADKRYTIIITFFLNLNSPYNYYAKDQMVHVR